jgi:hypothetical protein
MAHLEVNMLNRSYEITAFVQWDHGFGIMYEPFEVSILSVLLLSYHTALSRSEIPMLAPCAVIS